MAAFSKAPLITNYSITYHLDGLRAIGGRLARLSPVTRQADGVGFEPTRRFRRPHALQACAFNRSATRPNKSGAERRTSRSDTQRLESFQLPRQGSNLESLGPEPSVLPVTLRGSTTTCGLPASLLSVLRIPLFGHTQFIGNSHTDN